MFSIGPSCLALKLISLKLKALNALKTGLLNGCVPLVVAASLSAVVSPWAEARSAGEAAQARQASGLAPVALATLPLEAQATHRLILAGGPFRYDKDGSVFGNREKLLPLKTRGHYREYTVKTPGAKTRGARRIVCGGTPSTQPEVCFYTADHYASFSRITP